MIRSLACIFIILFAICGCAKNEPAVIHPATDLGGIYKGTVIYEKVVDVFNGTSTITTKFDSVLYDTSFYVFPFAQDSFRINVNDEFNVRKVYAFDYQFVSDTSIYVSSFSPGWGVDDFIARFKSEDSMILHQHTTIVGMSSFVSVSYFFYGKKVQ